MANKIDNDFMATTYPAKAGDKWDASQGGPMPTKPQHMLASYFGVRLGSKQALALALTMRPDGSTAGQRSYAGDGKSQNNIGGLQDILRQQHKTAKLVAGQPYKVTLANGAVFNVVSNKAGHVAATLVKGPDTDVTPKVAAKVQARADAADKAKGKAKAKSKKAKGNTPDATVPQSDTPDATVTAQDNTPDATA